jgi:hypothetical protein
VLTGVRPQLPEEAGRRQIQQWLHRDWEENKWWWQGWPTGPGADYSEVLTSLSIPRCQVGYDEVEINGIKACARWSYIGKSSKEECDKAYRELWGDKTSGP